MVELNEYWREAGESYFFENDHEWYIGKEALDFVKCKINGQVELADNSKVGTEQFNALYRIEVLKLKLAIKEIEVDVYRSKLKIVVGKFYESFGFSVLDLTPSTTKFYDWVNEYYSTTERGGEDVK